MRVKRFLCFSIKRNLIKREMDRVADGLVGVGGGGGRLELCGEGEGRMDGAVPSAEVSSSHDDDDGCGGTVQD